MADLVDLADIEAAARQIAGQVVHTPTVPSPGLSALLGVPVTTKLEHLQRSGSFKTRGVFAKIATLTAAERDAGLVAVSGGNHGIAVADAAGDRGIRATVVMPDYASARAVDGCRAAGAEVRLTPDVPAAFALATELQAAGSTLVHPFDDPATVAGQGTVGLELARDLPEPVTDVLVSIGGGGLVSGVAAAVRALLPGVRVWGVETVGAEAMSAALRAGGPVPVELSSFVTSLSAPSASQLTYDHVRELVHEVLVVSDDEALQGTVELAEHGRVWAEPAAGCLVPAARRVIDRVDAPRLAFVVCGGNTSFADIAARVR